MITGVCGVQRLVSDSGLYRSKGKGYQGRVETKSFVAILPEFDGAKI